MLGNDETAARGATGKALAAFRETWAAEATARNLRLVREARIARGEAHAWAEQIEQAMLTNAASSGCAGMVVKLCRRPPPIGLRLPVERAVLWSA